MRYLEALGGKAVRAPVRRYRVVLRGRASTPRYEVLETVPKKAENGTVSDRP
jgi:hypothetical protein